MQEALKLILDIQELDMKMIRLMRLKKQRLNELAQLQSLKADLAFQVDEKQKSVMDLKKRIRIYEGQIEEVKAKIKRLEAQQDQVKKVDEYNALTQEMLAAQRERASHEQQVGELTDTLATQEEALTTLKKNLEETESNGRTLLAEIEASVSQINSEGREIQKQRDLVAKDADETVLNIYERLLRNRKDRVVVPIEQRACSGCHIVLTPQHENLVRRGERLVFCEYCSRILYWPESSAASEGEEAAPKRRRRRSVAA